MPNTEHYSSFVEHPRFGRGPRFTGLNPQTDLDGNTFIHWHSPESCRIPKTAIAANLAQQVSATFAVTHYYDVKRKCRDCGRMFIFFAAEQKYWYEDLQFGLDSDCVRCVPCRKQQQGVARSRQQYEALFHVPHRTAAQSLTMAECCLDLIENGVFTQKQTQRIRMLLNQLPNCTANIDRIEQIRQRLRNVECCSENAL